MEKHRYIIQIQGSLCFPCSEDISVLVAMEMHGIDAIGVGCRGGGCGICRVRVIEGKYRTGKMSVSKISAKDRDEGFVLACRLYPDSELLLELGG